MWGKESSWLGKLDIGLLRYFGSKTPHACQATLRKQSDVTLMTNHFKKITDSLRAKRIPHRLITRNNEIVSVKGLPNVWHKRSNHQMKASILMFLFTFVLNTVFGYCRYCVLHTSIQHLVFRQIERSLHSKTNGIY